MVFHYTKWIEQTNWGRFRKHKQYYISNWNKYFKEVWFCIQCVQVNYSKLRAVSLLLKNLWGRMQRRVQQVSGGSWACERDMWSRKLQVAWASEEEQKRDCNLWSHTTFWMPVTGDGVILLVCATKLWSTSVSNLYRWHAMHSWKVCLLLFDSYGLWPLHICCSLLNFDLSKIY